MTIQNLGIPYENKEKETKFVMKTKLTYYKLKQGKIDLIYEKPKQGITNQNEAKHTKFIMKYWCVVKFEICVTEWTPW